MVAGVVVAVIAMAAVCRVQPQDYRHKLGYCRHCHSWTRHVENTAWHNDCIPILPKIASRTIGRHRRRGHHQLRLDSNHRRKWTWVTRCCFPLLRHGDILGHFPCRTKTIYAQLVAAPFAVVALVVVYVDPTKQSPDPDSPNQWNYLEQRS